MTRKQLRYILWVLDNIKVPGTPKPSRFEVRAIRANMMVWEALRR